MATNKVWSPASPEITNGQIKIANPPSSIKSNLKSEEWIRLNPNSANPAIKNLEYRVNNLNVIEYRYPTTSDPNGPKTITNSIQNIADDRLYVAAYGYSPQTTRLIQDSLRKDLITRSTAIGWGATGPVPPAPKLPSPNETNPPQGGNPNSGTSSSPEPTELTLDPNKLSKISGNNVRSGYGDLRYPLTLNSNIANKQDVIKFTMIEYTPPNALGVGIGENFGKKNPQSGKPKGTVILPIQPTIVDSNSVNWQQDSLNPLELAALNLSQGFIEQGPEGLNKALDSVTKNLSTEKDSVKNAILAAVMSEAIGKNIVARTTGAILNPNVELFFNGPSLRVFNYSFKLSARSKPESQSIQKIIRFFKQGMSVQRSAAELFLVTPDIFKIEYLLKESTDHPYINKIKICALTNCSVDYTPTGSYMTFKDGAMVSYTLNLTFEELEPVYHDEYEQLSKDAIGY
jgi:hypothetical protein